MKYDDENFLHLQKFTLSEMRNVFLRKVDTIIFVEREIRSAISVGLICSHGS